MPIVIIIQIPQAQTPKLFTFATVQNQQNIIQFQIVMGSQTAQHQSKKPPKPKPLK